MQKIKILSVMCITALLISGCFGDTETHRANEGKPDTGASVHMKKE